MSVRRQEISTVALSRRRRSFAAAAVATGTVLMLAACGGSDEPATPDAQAPGGGQNPLAAYTQCLAQNGVTLPSMGMPGGVRPSGGPGPSGFPRPSGAPGASGRPAGGPGGGAFEKPADVDDATWQKAQDACAGVRPSFGAGGPGGQGRPGGGNQPDTAYATCLRDRGVDAAAINTADPKAMEALDACKVLSPTPTAS